MGAKAGDQSHRRRLNVTFHPRYLAGEEDVVIRPKLQGLFQEGRRVNEGVTVNAAVAGKFRILQPRYGPEDSLLLRPG